MALLTGIINSIFLLVTLATPTLFYLKHIFFYNVVVHFIDYKVQILL